jgi:glycosyltransferase involved in cell wall biosynthesis
VKKKKDSCPYGRNILKMNKELSIIVPCYNEEKNLLGVLEKTRKSSLKHDISFELILVDNNSKDNTKRVLDKLLKKKKYSFARYAFEPMAGYGSAINRGIKSANGEYICWTHADLQTDPNDVFKAMKMLKSEENPKECFVKGRRYGRSLFENFFTLGMSAFESIILRERLYDINGQPNLFHRSFLPNLKEIPLDFSIDLYVYYMARRNNFKIIRFPVFFGKRIHGKSTWNTGMLARWKLIKRTIEFSFRMKRNLSN